MKKKNLWIYILAGLSVAAVIAYLKGFFTCLSEGDAKEAIRVLCDAFTIPGVLLTGIGGLIWLGSQGTFDIFGYAVHSFILPLRRSEEAREAKTYAEYSQSLNEKGRKWDKTMLLVGLGFISLAVIMLTVYTLI